MDEKTTEQKVKKYAKRNFYTKQDSSLVFVLSIIIPLFVGLVFMLIMQAIALRTGAISETDLISVIYGEIWFAIPYLIIGEGSFLLIYWLYHFCSQISYSATKISVKKANVGTVVICMLIGIVCVLGFMWLIEGCFGKLFTVTGIAGDESTTISLPNSNVWWLLLSFLLLGVLPAICEELLCRGIVFKGLKNSYSSVVAIFLSALLFALMHGSLEQFVYPFFMGVVLATIMDCTNNLVYCMVMHAASNCTSLLLDFLIDNKLIALDFSASWMTSWWGILCAIALALVTVGILFVVWKFYFKKHPKLEETSAQVVASDKKGRKIPLMMVVGIVLSVLIIVINSLPVA